MPSPLFVDLRERVVAAVAESTSCYAARTVTDLRAEIGNAFARFKPRECQNSIAAVGYEDELAVVS